MSCLWTCPLISFQSCLWRPRLWACFLRHFHWAVVARRSHRPEAWKCSVAGGRVLGDQARENIVRPRREPAKAVVVDCLPESSLRITFLLSLGRLVLFGFASFVFRCLVFGLVL